MKAASAQTVLKALRKLDAVPIENRIGSGTPDVQYIGGWIELKCLKEWPKDEHAIVKIPHYTKEQRLWLRRRWSRGGYCWLLLQVKREWLLFDGLMAPDAVGCSSRFVLKEIAKRYWPNGLKKEELYNLLAK